MSIQAVAWAIGQKTGSPTGKVVLICLANYANEEGCCWPSQATIAQETELSERAVREWLQRLEDQGLLSREHRQRSDGSRKSDLIRLKILPANSAGRGESNRQEVPIQPAGGSGLTSFEPSREPSDNYAAARTRSEVDLIRDKLLDAAGEKIQPHGALVLAPILGLLDAGVDLETDILPTIRARVPKLRRPAGSWAYFTEAIRDAYSRRVEAGVGLSKPVASKPFEGWVAGLSEQEARAKWAKTLEFARPREEWKTGLWGPPPGQEGCLVPDELLEPKDKILRWSEQRSEAA